MVPEPFQLRLGREVGNIHLPAKGGIAQAHDALRRHTLFEQNRQAVLQEVGADEPLLLANPEEHVVRNRVLKEPVVGIVSSRALSFDIALDKLLEPFARIVSNGVVPYFAVGVERKIELESVFLWSCHRSSMSFQMKFRASYRLVAPPLICFEQLVGPEEQIYGVEIPEGADSFGLHGRYLGRRPTPYRELPVEDVGGQIVLLLALGRPPLVREVGGVLAFDVVESAAEDELPVPIPFGILHKIPVAALHDDLQPRKVAYAVGDIQVLPVLRIHEGPEVVGRSPHVVLFEAISATQNLGIDEGMLRDPHHTACRGQHLRIHLVPEAVGIGLHLVHAQGFNPQIGVEEAIGVMLHVAFAGLPTVRLLREEHRTPLGLHGTAAPQVLTGDRWQPLVAELSVVGLCREHVAAVALRERVEAVLATVEKVFQRYGVPDVQLLGGCGRIQQVAVLRRFDAGQQRGIGRAYVEKQHRGNLPAIGGVVRKFVEQGAESFVAATGSLHSYDLVAVIHGDVQRSLRLFLILFLFHRHSSSGELALNESADSTSS